MNKQAIPHTAADMRRKTQRGLTLIELMIAITLGMLVMAAVLALFLNITRSNSELAKTNRLIENGRFAIQVLQNDLVHAGFWGEMKPAAPLAIPDPCAAVASWDAAYKANMLGTHVFGYNSATIPGSCTAVSGAQANSDVLVVRHANTCTAGSANCDGWNDSGPHIQVSGCNATPPEAAYVVDINTAPFPLKKKDCTTAAVKRKVVSNIYYVTNNTLMRVAFINGTYQAAQPLIEGIEALRVEYGIDTDGNGSADTYASCAPCTLAQLANVVAVKIHVLARNLEKTPGYTDNKAYQLGATAFTVPSADVGFKRHVFSSTVRLVNPSGRREVP